MDWFLYDNGLRLERVKSESDDNRHQHLKWLYVGR